ncbi:MAG: UbiD family decarboxylase [Pseudomonadota bacterium]|jgi:UbiD family decarboxylase|nr:UbiD family decarboxylase [Pseudomonadota bacterium]|tara:strand:+ start:1123 stop:2625 length:1503 start_codon:yes stop_codon:yes gene_type:complete
MADKSGAAKQSDGPIIAPQNELKIPYNDLRQWLEEAEKLGEVKHVQGASWERDIGMASEVVQHNEKAPCVVFEDVPGTIEGSRVLVNFFAAKRMNMTLGFPSDLSKIELTDAFRQAYMENMKEIPHVTVDDGPVLENVLEGDDIDVEAFPTPMWHEDDGGRYIGTGSYNVTRDPDTGWINIGTYRVMVQSKNEVGFYISPGKHGRIHRDKFEASGEPMPALIVAGGDPMTFLMGCSEVPPNMCEFDVVGGFRGEAMKMIEGKHTGLPFPADAEVVLEGFVHPTKRKEEGPFGEWTGYYGSKMREEPIMEVKAVYHRNNPILLGCPPQRPPDELARYRAVTRSALLKENIAKAGVPDVEAAWLHEVGTARMLIGVSIKQRYPGHAKQAGHIACQCHVGAYAGKYVIVTDEDIDVSNLEELIWAMLTRSDPAESIEIIRGTWSTHLDPRIPPEDKAKGNLTNSRAIIDACRPFHWKDDFPPVNAPSPGLAKEARDKWGHLCD